jgi:hypothetical protein
MTRWSLVVNDKTDQSLRAFLGQRSAKKGDLSKFIEEAVLDKLFVETVRAVKERNSLQDQDAVMSIIDEAVEAVREGRA